MDPRKKCTLYGNYSDSFQKSPNCSCKGYTFLKLQQKGLILYTSKYGSTEKYAKRLSHESGFALARTADADIRTVRQYNTIVLGGGVYASGIAGLQFLKKHFDALKDKRLAVFCCGASPYDEQAFEAIVTHNLTGKLQGIPCFYCRGAFDMKGMSFGDRTLCKMPRKVVARKDPKVLEPWEAALISVDEDEAADWADKAYIEPILKEVGRRVS